MPTALSQLTEAQIEKLTAAGLMEAQIAALPNVRGLTSEQIRLADELGLFGDDPKELTQEELAALTDEDIDYTDAPEWTDDDFARAILFSPKPIKEPITIRLDKEVLDYFKRPGAGY